MPARSLSPDHAGQGDSWKGFREGKSPEVTSFRLSWHPWLSCRRPCSNLAGADLLEGTERFRLLALRSLSTGVSSATEKDLGVELGLGRLAGGRVLDSACDQALQHTNLRILGILRPGKT